MVEMLLGQERDHMLGLLLPTASDDLGLTTDTSIAESARPQLQAPTAEVLVLTDTEMLTGISSFISYLTHSYTK